MTDKTDFGDIYVQADPRAYYTTLRELDYQVPTHGEAAFAPLIARLAATLGRRPVVADLCCSYGVNAALLNHRLTMSELTDHYGAADGLDHHGLVLADRAWYGERREPVADVVGVDVAAPAVAYAIEVGLHVAGVTTDLEHDDPTPAEADALAGTDLITVTGGIGYIGPATFHRVLAAAQTAPWVAALCLRWVDYGPSATALAEHGLVTERLAGFVARQRRFTDAAEREFALGELARLGVDPTGHEAEGYHCAELFVSRPEPAADPPLDRLLADLTRE